MSAEVDIKQLAIVRDAPEAPALRRRRHVVSRYVIPGVLLVGFLGLVAWAARDAVSPPAPVWVTPVLASQSQSQHEGTPLFQATGWIEPRPTPIRVAALAPGVVEQLLVVENQAVKAGEPGAELVKQDAELAYQRAQANVKLREAELLEAEAGMTAATTRLEQPVHLQAALGEAEAALAATTTDLKNLPFATRRAEAELEFAAADYEGKRSSEGAIARRIVNKPKARATPRPPWSKSYKSGPSRWPRSRPLLSSGEMHCERSLSFLRTKNRPSRKARRGTTPRQPASNRRAWNWPKPSCGSIA